MEIKSFLNLRKIIFVIFCAIAASFVIFAVKNWTAIFPDTSVPPAPVATEISAPSSSSEQPAPPKEEYPKQAVIGLKSWSDVESAKKIITDNGGKIISVLDWPTEKVITASIPNKETEQKILNNSFLGKIIGGIGLSSFGNKISGGINYLEEDQEVPPPPAVGDLGQIVDWGVVRVQADKVWGVTRGAGVKIGIIDTGIDPNHEDYKLNLKGGINFTITKADGTVHPDQWWNDDEGHGTGVAGAIGARDNGFGVVGIAPEADIYSIKVLPGETTTGTVSTIISGIYWAADNGMDILQMSVAALVKDSPSNPYWREQFAKALDYASQRGALLVGAAGNEALVNNVVVWPAAYDAVIAVGALDKDNARASFSSYGPEIDIAAPGVEFLTTSTENPAPRYPRPTFVPGAGYYKIGYGTSIAAPVVSGVAALIMAKDPKLTATQVRDILESTAVDLGAPGKDNEFGYGLVNAYDSVLNLPPVVISLVSPVGGELWYKDIKQEIKWTMDTHGEIVNKADIKLIHQQGITTETISLVTNAPNNGSKEIIIPKDLPSSSATDSYFIQVSCAKEYFGKCQPAKSGPLNIQELPSQKFSIIYPNGGEKWPQGTVQSIVWSANYLGGANVDVTLLEKKQAPQYALGSQAGDWSSQVARWYDSSGKYWVWDNTQNYTAKFNAGFWVNKLNDDTCDGNIGSDINNGIFVCPAISSTGTFSCVDVAKSKIYPNDYWERNVTCEYKNNDIGTKAPIYSFISGSEKRAVYDPTSGYSFGSPWFADIVGFLSYNPPSLLYVTDSPVPPDTCHGNYEPWKTTGMFSCPDSNTSEHLRCVDIWGGGGKKISYYQGFVDCSYQQKGTVTVPAVVKDVPVAKLATNVLNKGSLEILVPGNISGDNYRIQLSCANFIGDCVDGLSVAPFSIIHLANPKILTINKTGNGAVTDGNIYCITSLGACEESYEKGELVTLTARPADSSVIFDGWSGNNSCSGTGTCQIVMDSDQSVTANFLVRSVTVVAIAEQGSVFMGWSGDCLNNGQCSVSWTKVCHTNVPCNITMSSDQVVIPTFFDGSTLQINKVGLGTGTVIGKQINCGANCSSTYVLGDLETLSVSVGPESVFAGWAGACTGTGACNVVMDGDKSVTATFTSTNLELNLQDLIDSKSGLDSINGSGDGSGDGSEIPLNPGEIKEVIP